MKRSISLTLLCASFFTGRCSAEGTNSTTLSETYKETLERNFDVLQARKDLERAAGTKIELRSRDLGAATIESSAGFRKGPLYGNGGLYALATAEVYQPLFNTGMLAQWRRGKGEVLAAEQQLNLTVSDRLQEARMYYLRAQRLQQLIALYEELGTRLDNNVTSEKQRQSVGMTGPQFLLQAKVQVLTQQGTLISLRREQSDVQIQLAGLMNRSLDSLPRPAEDLKLVPVSFDWKEEAQKALHRRADLKLLRQLIQNAKDDQTVVKAGYYPSLTLIGSGLYIPGKKLLYQNTQIVEGQTPYGSEARFGGAASWQIIDNGQVTGVSREIKAVWQQYEVTLKQLEENIPRELARLSHEMEDADAKFGALNQSVQHADENLRMIESRISLGLATQLDFSDAQRNLLAVRTGVVEAIFQYESAVARLDWVTGRYLEFAEPVRQR